LRQRPILDRRGVRASLSSRSDDVFEIDHGSGPHQGKRLDYYVTVEDEPVEIDLD
jgi:hypothetical protein